MGAVYRGKHLKFGIDVGVKLLLPKIPLGGERVVLRFEREASAGRFRSGLLLVFPVKPGGKVQLTDSHYQRSTASVCMTV